jgi:hypothetical protein
MHEITIAGKKYPVRLSMGAIREFKRQTGKEVDDITGISDMGELLYACTVSTCRLQGKKFSLTVEQFTDDLDVTQATTAFTGVLSEGGFSSAAAEPEDKKKEE